MNDKVRQLDDSRRDVVILVNPKAGYRSREELIDEMVEQLACRQFVTHLIENADHLGPLTHDLETQGRLRAVIAAGGDGTISLAANLTDPQTPLVTLPLGTENLLAKYLEIPTDIQTIAEIVETGTVVKLDAGRANGRLFMLMVGIGFDADVVHRLHHQRTGHIHHLSYAKPILDSIRNYEYPELRVRYGLAAETTAVAGSMPAAESSESTETIPARWVFVVNLPRYAGGLSLVPDASGVDGQLDVCTFKEGSIWKGLWYLGGVMLGQHQHLADCVIAQTDRLTIETDAESVPYQLDGDPGGFLPVEVEVIPERLSLLVPSHWPTSHMKPR